LIEGVAGVLPIPFFDIDRQISKWIDIVDRDRDRKA